MTSNPTDALTEPQLEPSAASTVPTHLRRLVLTGFMGAGKSTIGRILASRIGWTFLDLDDHLEQRTGATIPQLFERHGEARFPAWNPPLWLLRSAAPTPSLLSAAGLRKALPIASSLNRHQPLLPSSSMLRSLFSSTAA